MNLYLLTRKPNHNSFIYDVYNGMLIRAESEERARQIANTQHGDEGKIWNNKKKVECEIVEIEGEEEIIISDFNAG